MAVVRQAGVLLLAALIMSRGLFAQDSAAVVTASPADQVKVLLRPTEIRYMQQESVLLPPTAKIKGLYVNAWAFGSKKLWQLVRLADETEINAFVVDVKDDTGCLLYPSTVPTAELSRANVWRPQSSRRTGPRGPSARRCASMWRCSRTA